MPKPRPKASRNRKKRTRTRKRQRSCIVIGAGLAGLAAARILVNKGWNVTVLENLKRAGGRVYTHHFEKEAPHLNCELGGEWIGNDHKKMLQLCGDFCLDLQDHKYSSFFWDGTTRSPKYGPTTSCFPRKTENRFEAFCRKFRNPRRFGTAKRKALDKLDWWTWLESKELRFSPKELVRRDMGDSTDFGESIRQVSAFVAASEYAHSDESDEMDSKIVGGNSLLIDALEAHINKGHGCKVFKKKTVRRVHQDAKGVKVYVRGSGIPFRADYCICATPAHCLTKITWSPPLPKDKSRAAEQLQYSRIMKSAILYQHRFWKSGKKSGFAMFTNRVSDFCFDSTFLQPGPMGIITSYAVGDKADDLDGERNLNNVMKWITEDVASAVQPPSKIIIAPIAIKTQPRQSQKWIRAPTPSTAPVSGSRFGRLCSGYTGDFALPGNISRRSGQASWKGQSKPVKPPPNH